MLLLLLGLVGVGVQVRELGLSLDRGVGGLVPVLQIEHLLPGPLQHVTPHPATLLPSLCRRKVLLSFMLSSTLWNEFCPPPDWKFCSAPAAPNWLAKGDATKLQRETLRETIGRITLVSPTLQIWTDNCADHLNPNFYYILMGSTIK